MKLIQVNKEKCTKCGRCADICPAKIFKMEENGPNAVNPEICIACGHCVAICPNAAIDNIKTPLSNQLDLLEFPVIGSDVAYHFMRSRRSIRCYKSESISKEKLLKLVDIARFAPTASNKQGISYIIVNDRTILKKATEVVIQWMEKNHSHWWSFPRNIKTYREQGIDVIFRSAPNIVIANAPKDFERGRENTILSLAYLELYANTLGIGSVWAGLFEMCAFSNYEPLLELFKIPKDKSITGAIILGYPKYNFQRLVDRKPLDVTWLSDDEV